MRISRCPACFAAHHLPIPQPAFCAVCRATLRGDALEDLPIPGESVHHAAQLALDAEPTGDGTLKTTFWSHETTRPSGSRSRAFAEQASIIPASATLGASSNGSEASTGDGSNISPSNINSLDPDIERLRRIARRNALGAVYVQIAQPSIAPQCQLPRLDPPLDRSQDSVKCTHVTKNPAQTRQRHRNFRQASIFAIALGLTLTLLLQILLFDPQRIATLAQLHVPITTVLTTVCSPFPCERYPSRSDWHGAELEDWFWEHDDRRATLVIQGITRLYPTAYESDAHIASFLPSLTRPARETPPIGVVDVNDRLLLTLPPQRSTSPGLTELNTARVTLTKDDVLSSLDRASASKPGHRSAPKDWAWEIRIAFHPASAHIDSASEALERRFVTDDLIARVGGVRFASH
ncbi:MAG: hypothetical protein ACK4IT_03615 [Thioalkalivibrionaceae bacterium]